ncbi:hypothetical protein MBM_02351 [Drepanopeziza brunnea f. sp. 'multigermtubi' MB_m1]|uniref:Uncharacterized protein n=1 Tax=Marssonina brunnea f. sp. multigermtubi (strain MB_m1) TaxID=1072389 RepID=K1Y1V8_MARBU|nr:uncharacterized protein MBM_02351 [Drepanopeziza brunnea f. sp. 'multigermtubi' MB_m1]EKD19114.1 hypothetical protein MBM_02351 [Drepanopeziza brunnea f. sp. 'multigermtubi' MB_m1]
MYGMDAHCTTDWFRLMTLSRMIVSSYEQGQMETKIIPYATRIEYITGWNRKLQQSTSGKTSRLLEDAGREVDRSDRRREGTRAHAKTEAGTASRERICSSGDGRHTRETGLAKGRRGMKREVRSKTNEFPGPETKGGRRRRVDMRNWVGTVDKNYDDSEMNCMEVGGVRRKPVNVSNGVFCTDYAEDRGEHLLSYLLVFRGAVVATSLEWAPLEPPDGQLCGTSTHDKQGKHPSDRRRGGCGGVAGVAGNLNQLAKCTIHMSLTRLLGAEHQKNETSKSTSFEHSRLQLFGTDHQGPLLSTIAIWQHNATTAQSHICTMVQRHNA